MDLRTIITFVLPVLFDIVCIRGGRKPCVIESGSSDIPHLSDCGVYVCVNIAVGNAELFQKVIGI